MKRQTYLEFIQTLLPEQEFLSFKEYYQARLPKSIKIVNTKISLDDFHLLISHLHWNLKSSQLTNGNELYDDVLVVEKEDKASLWSSFLHESWFFLYHYLLRFFLLRNEIWYLIYVRHHDENQFNWLIGLIVCDDDFLFQMNRLILEERHWYII